jgi:3-oxoacyl-[acyl-carrier protein] reductase
MAESRVMLITGTRKGIGKYLAEYYVKRGFRVIGCSRSPVEYELENYRHFCLDISDESKIVQMFVEIRESYEKLDVVINNAAINPSIIPAILMPTSSLNSSFQVNFLGTFLVSREAAKLMMRGQFGRIINFASMAVRLEVPGESIYTATKAAVISFSRVFAKEIHRLGITCNVVAPAAIETDLSAAVDADALAEVLKRNAVQSFGEMADVSNTIDWLIKPESQAITGQVIYLGGV